MRRLEKEKRPMPYPVTGFSLCVNDPVGRRLGQEEEVYLPQVSALTGFLSLLKGCKINAIRRPPDFQSIDRSGGGVGFRVLGGGPGDLRRSGGWEYLSLIFLTASDFEEILMYPNGVLSMGARHRFGPFVGGR